MSKQRVSISPSEGDQVELDGLGVIWKIAGFETGNRFSVVHHPIPPRTLAAHLHYHHREDEYSFVLEGTLGALLGDEVVTAGPGSWVYKPRGQWHTFWNAGDSRCTIIEVISPAGFEEYFRELALLVGQPKQKIEALNRKYALDMDLDSVPWLCERFGLVHPDYNPKQIK